MDESLMDKVWRKMKYEKMMREAEIDILKH